MCSYGFVDLAAELQKIYDSEINIRISWLWDGGIEVWLGREMNGFLAQETVKSAAEIGPWMQEAIAHFYPESTYAASLDPHVRQRAVTRLFFPPRAGAQVICPHCGLSPCGSAWYGPTFQFICMHCGSSVEVPPPKIQ
jgi:hypothetical protein